MVIEKISDSDARVIVHSYQDNQHVCHADGVAQVIDNSLKYCLDYEPGTCLLISQVSDKLTLRVIVDGTRYIPFCGSRATLDGLEFPLNSKLLSTRCNRH
ncbi:MAG: hypothetical protein EXR86_08255 [Gammaproteobacteria bacterium]|nr:hypothetical protein [Gammaproteobacteria bacterium]